MRLYHMTTLGAAEQILKHRRMRLSRFNMVNDPFELMSLKIAGGRPARNAFKTVIDSFTSKLGMLSMVKHWKSPLMWAHYADKNQGVCLGFDISNNKLHEVQYTAERKVHVWDNEQYSGGISKEDLNKLLATKSAGWKYEEEWRLLATLVMEPDPVDGHHYLAFCPNLALREIIVGSACDESVESFQKQVGDVDQSVKIIKARPAFKTFTMVRQRALTPIVVSPKDKHTVSTA